MLEYTGERMVPERADGRTFWEHIERYRFAARHVVGQRVLDIACGEGYGSAALAKAGARSVVGVDVCADTCAHARDKYQLDARVGSAEAIPLLDKSVDLVVSFETVEHLQDIQAFIAECSRVLSPTGSLILSTPNRPVYRQLTPNNPYHHHELNLEEFEALLGTKFRDPVIFAQCPPVSPLFERPGWRRLRRWFHRLMCPQIVREPSTDSRSRTENPILTAPRWSDRFNPFALHEASRARLARACYLVALTTKAPS